MFIVYSTPTCVYCDFAKGFLKQRDLEYEERPITHPDFPKTARTVPQIFYRKATGELEYVGGWTELQGYVK